MNSTDGQMWRYSSFVLQCYNNTNKCTTDECVVWSTWVCVPVCRSNNNIFCFDCVDRRTVLFDTLWMNEHTREGEKRRSHQQIWLGHIGMMTCRAVSIESAFLVERSCFLLFRYYISGFSVFCVPVYFGTMMPKIIKNPTIYGRRVRAY